MEQELKAKRTRAWSLNRILVLYILLISSIFTTIITLVSFLIDYNQEMSLLEDNLEQIQKSTIRTVTKLLWDYSDGIIRDQINSTLAISNVYEIRVLDSKKNLVAGNTSKAIKEKRFLASVEYPLIHKGQEIGAFIITVSKYEIYKKLFYKALYVFGSQGIKTLAVSAILLVLFQSKVTRHILAINDYFRKMKGDDSPTFIPLNLNKKDTRNELNDLADSVNETIKDLYEKKEQLKRYYDELELRIKERTRDLERAQKQLLDNAFAAGKAEVAEDIIFNIGNVINTVNISATMINENLTGTHLKELMQIGAVLLNEKQDPNEIFANEKNRQMLIKYLSGSFKVFKGILPAQGHHINRLIESIDVINQAIASQQDISRTSSTVEEVKITNYLDKQLNIFAYSAGDQIKIEKDFQADFSVTINRSSFGQAIMNILVNAKDAMQGLVDKKIILKVGFSEAGWGVISITDNGLGIPSEDINKIYDYGFTTKTNSKGYGMHYTANVIKEMSGKLTVASEEHRGATFTIQLPSIRKIESSKAA